MTPAKVHNNCFDENNVHKLMCIYIYIYFKFILFVEKPAGNNIHVYIILCTFALVIIFRITTCCFIKLLLEQFYISTMCAKFEYYVNCSITSVGF